MQKLAYFLLIVVGVIVLSLGATHELPREQHPFTGKAPKELSIPAQETEETNNSFSSSLDTMKISVRASHVDCSETPCVALTFDDGPNPTHTPRVLAALERNNVPGTFFLVGNNVATYPDLVRQELEAGHTIASHTWDHPQLSRLAAGDITSQITRTDEAIASAIAQSDVKASGTSGSPKNPAEFHTQLLRPPYGDANSGVYSVLGSLDKTAIMWDVDTEDWRNRNAEISCQRALAAQPGSIILFHDVHPVAENSIDCVVSHLRARGYEFVTVDNLLDDNTYAGQPIFSRSTVIP